jgi:6-phosphogluconolactonase
MSDAGEVRVSPSVAEAQQACAKFLADAIGEVLERGGRCSVALSGGSTPKRTYELLAAAPLDWSRVDVVFADERCVPPDHPDSNYKLVRDTLKAPAHFVRMRGEDTPEAAAKAYARELPATVDIIVLGMGPDGHTASLFPGQGTVHSGERVLAVHNSPKPPPDRISVGPSVIVGARVLVMLVTGADKAEALARARSSATSVDEIPAALARRATWFVDAAAAASLKG